jgi:diguanylate cyclase (GGDEF)-like protein
MALVAVVVEGLDIAAAVHGDEAALVLRRKIAVRLRGAVRASDVVASLGGEVFALLLAKIKAAGDAQRVAAKVAWQLREPFLVLCASLAVRGHVGVAVTPADGDDAQRLLDQALAAARSTQRTGRAAAND